MYAVGGSNGGMMSYRLAMELTHRIAAVGAVAANLPADPTGECSAPSAPITVAMMNGDADQVFMPWGGGCVVRTATVMPEAEEPIHCQRGRVRSAEATRDWWIEANGASVGAEPHVYPDTTVEDLSTVTRWIHADGGNGTEVAFLRVYNAGHSNPSIEHRSPPAQRVVTGGQNWDIEGAVELWNILKRHARVTAPSPQPPS